MLLRNRFILGSFFWLRLSPRSSNSFSCNASLSHNGSLYSCIVPMTPFLVHHHHHRNFCTVNESVRYRSSPDQNETDSHQMDSLRRPLSDRRGNFRFSRSQLRGVRSSLTPERLTLVPGAGPEKSLRRQGDWDCAFCSLVNHGYRWRCKGCSKEKSESDEENGMPPFRERSSRPDESRKNSDLLHGDWTCPDENCGVLNFARRGECVQCRTPRPGISLRKGDWTCKECNTFNFAKRAECMKCRSDRNSDEYASEDSQSKDHLYEKAQNRRGGRGKDNYKDDDWECVSCGSLNFGFRSECKECGQAKE